MATVHFHLNRRMPLNDNNNNTDGVLISNHTGKMETTSLAEELRAFRKKMERLRLDKEKTEKMLEEREAVLHLQMKEMEKRGQIQTLLEIQVDRLFRLKELKSYCMRISPLKSLRERQRGAWHIAEN